MYVLVVSMYVYMYAYEYTCGSSRLIYKILLKKIHIYTEPRLKLPPRIVFSVLDSNIIRCIILIIEYF